MHVLIMFLKVECVFAQEKLGYLPSCMQKNDSYLLKMKKELLSLLKCISSYWHWDAVITERI